MTQCLGCGVAILNPFNRLPGHTYNDDFCKVCGCKCVATKNPACGKCGAKVYPVIK